MENERVRVLKVRLKPGQKAAMHNHPNDHVVYVKYDARFKLRLPDGKDSAIDLKAGHALWLEAGPHETENAGATEGLNP
jgi:quercetin dioxygenase-like cupin family protein